MDVDEEGFVFVGTPIEREEEVGSRRKKAAAEASGFLRSLPSWKQEVRDEEGRRRFHGAFTGGFSAGYYNTVGSKEGWTPQSFTSSRKNRAAIKQQSILNFLDEDEKAELEGQSVGTSSQFDTFGFTAAEYARKEADKEQNNRPSAIPGPVPDELVLPVTESIGVKLLIKMGWRRGRAIKDSHPDSLSDARREARKALLAFGSDDATALKRVDSEPVGDLDSLVAQPVDDVHQDLQNTNVCVPNPKQDLHGLGYDPFKHAPEFREKKRTRLSSNKEPGSREAVRRKDNLFGGKSGKAAPGFGIGALEEFDAEDEDVYSSGYDFEETLVEEDEEPAKLETASKPRLGWKEQGVLPGFRVASVSGFQLERFDPPVIPKDFVPYHKFPGPLEREKSDIPPAPEVPPPDDNNLRLLIEGVATLVSRCGKLFEDLSREKNKSNPLFGFLSGGMGHDYYERKLWEECKKRNGSSRLSLDGKSSPSVQKMTAESRGKLLGEKPLERSQYEGTSSSTTPRDFSHLQVNLTDTFTKPSLFNESTEVAKPFKDDPSKQARFEQFLKEKYQGGLRSTNFNASYHMSEADRARERLDFEAVVEALEKGKLKDESKSSMQQALDFLPSSGLQFVSVRQEQVKDTQAADAAVKRLFPKREEFQWRPSPILCKRFDLVDPCMGKPPPAPRTKSKMDSLLFLTDSVNATKLEDDVRTAKELPIAHSDAENMVETCEEETKVENIERPVDLYKAIFSDDSEEEVEDSITNQAAESEKQIQAATTTLNRLIAGDFLESLGKELGLEVPPETHYQENKPKGPDKETPDAAAGDVKTVSIEKKSSSALGGEASISREESQQLETAQAGSSPKSRSIHSNNHHTIEDGLLLKRSDSPGKTTREGRKVESPSRHHVNRDFSSASSDDGTVRRRSRRHGYSSSDSFSDSARDGWDHYTSGSKRRKKKSSHGKSSSSRKHSKHHRHRSRDSLKRSSHYENERGFRESHKDKRRRRE